MALDQSSHVSGYAVFEDGKYQNSGIFSLKGADLGTRLCAYRAKVTELIDIFDIDEVAFEDIQFQDQPGGVTTYKVLAEVFGVTEEVLTELRKPYKIVNSNSWKSIIGIKGKQRDVQKKNAQKWVLDTYNKKVSSDESDAICIGASLYKKEKTFYSFE